MAAKLRINDPNGVLVFDSSIHKVMSHLFTSIWTYVVTPSGITPTKRFYDSRIKPLGTFAYIEYYNVSANQSVYTTNSIITIKYYDGYLDITLPQQSTHFSVSSLTVSYKVRVFNR